MGLQPTALPCTTPLVEHRFHTTTAAVVLKRKLAVTLSSSDSGNSANNSNDMVNLRSSSDEDEDEDDFEAIVPPPKKLCIEPKEDNKENEEASGELETILAKTFLSKETEDKKANAVEDLATTAPKVIVEMQPMPSIYDLQQINENTTNEGTNEDSFNDSGLSEDEEDLDEEGDEELEDEEEDQEEDDEEEEEEDDEDEPMPSPLFNSVLNSKNGDAKIVTPPKPLYNDRFWSQATSSGSSPFQMSNTSSSSSSSSSSVSTTPTSTTPLPPMSTTTAFEFLDQTNQRIECAENGKSYLQLGTVNQQSHHHLPVTPVIQPKPNMVYRRPIPPFRNALLPAPPTARPICDHSNCLQKKSSNCYKNTRSRMMNMSLHKLHLARTNHEGCLRRSVLICNLLRHIEEETEKENQNQQHHDTNLYDNHAMDVDPFWAAQPPSGPPVSAPPATMTPSQYHLTTGSPPPPPLPSSPAPPPPSAAAPGTYDGTLKDFNSTFRVATPFASPAHPDEDSAIGEDEDRDGINWGSVLSLSNQSELDPLNNNTFVTEPWTSTSSPSSTSAASSASTASTASGVPGQTFDDIGWKLSADDVLRAFPNDDGLFVGP